jgi:hypothetical protein
MQIGRRSSTRHSTTGQVLKTASAQVSPSRSACKGLAHGLRAFHSLTVQKVKASAAVTAFAFR